MLKLETARFTLKILLGLTLLSVMLSSVLFLWFQVSGGGGSLSWNLPVGLHLRLGDQTYGIRSFGSTIPSTMRWVTPLFLGYSLLSAAVVLLLFRRARDFIDRLIDNPFAHENAQDLRRAAGVALLWQGSVLLVTAVSWWVVRGLQPANALRVKLAEVQGVNVWDDSYNYSFTPANFFGINLTPLLVAALLAILATVFQRAHDLREAERSLRAEQELTV